MAIDEKKLRDYYQLKKIKVLLDQKLQKLNNEIKEGLEPGEHQVGKYKVNIRLRKRYDIDITQFYERVAPEVVDDCVDHVIQQDLVESAYLRGDISDDDMRYIRGDTVLIPSLTVEESDVQTDL